MIFELLVIIVVALCGYIPWLYWRSKAPTPDMILEMERLSRELRAKDSIIKATKGELQVKDNELQAKDTELQVKDTELQAKDTELQAKDIELQVKDFELQFRDTTISALEKKVEEVQDEKDERLESVINVFYKHQDFLEASAEIKYKCRYDEPMSDFHTRLQEVEEAYVAQGRALTAVTAEYSQMVAFARSNGTIPPPDEPALAHILIEYQEERMLSEEREEERRRLERASERRRRIINYLLNKIPPPTPPAPSLPPHEPGDLELDYTIRNLDCRITYASNLFRAQNRSIHVLGRYVTAFKDYVMEHAE